jgi:Ca2+-binding RTX toxin-like protein
METRVNTTWPPAGNGGNDILNGGGGNDTFVFTAGSAAGSTILDFAGNGANPGDSLEFHGFGAGTFTFVSGNQWQIHSGLDGHDEIITLNGTTSTSVHATNYQFLP